MIRRSIVGSALMAFVAVTSSLSAQAPQRVSGDSAAPAAPTRNISWTSDRRSFAVGDIIRVIIDESALARANKSTVNEASRSRDMGVGIEPPTMGTGTSAMGPVDGSIGTSDRGQSRNRGEAVRGTRYVGELAVRVVAVTPEGLLQIKGEKTIDVDKNKQEMMLTGFVRPQDVNAQDIVVSDAVASAQLSYKSKGGLGKPSNGILTKILGIFWP
jgi:flagellar L-ring protein FlgH